MTARSRETTKHMLRFGRETIPFEVEFRPKKRLSISVHPDSRVTVSAPAGRTLDEVLAHVQRRAAWIAKQSAHFRQFEPLPPPRRYVAGETHLYLGRQYRLKLHESDERSVKLIGRFFHLHLPDRDDPEAVESLLDRWYRDHARGIFDARLSDLLANASSLRALRPRLVVRRMSKRWGSCTKSGSILLNVELVKAPLHCIEYVLMHELCHLREPNHSPAFYRLLTRCMPDWERRKEKLDSFVV